MKLKTLLLFVLLSFVSGLKKEILAQNEFPYGVFLNDNDSTTTKVYKAVGKLGMNYVYQYAKANSSAIKAILDTINLLAVKEDKPEDYIGHYARGYYSKWESKENQLDDRKVGVKHNGGGQDTYNSVNCWSSQGEQNSILGLIGGPDYRQDKQYKLNYLKSTTLYYTVNFNMAYAIGTTE